jgi:hypothetical protein
LAPGVTPAIRGGVLVEKIGQQRLSRLEERFSTPPFPS